MAAPTKPADVKETPCQPGAVHTWPISAPSETGSMSRAGGSRHRGGRSLPLRFPRSDHRRVKLAAAQLFHQSLLSGRGDLHPDDYFFSSRHSGDAWFQGREPCTDEDVDLILADAVGEQKRFRTPGGMAREQSERSALFIAELNHALHSGPLKLAVP
jgi:hypothetical protein